MSIESTASRTRSPHTSGSASSASWPGTATTPVRHCSARARRSWRSSKRLRLSRSRVRRSLVDLETFSFSTGTTAGTVSSGSSLTLAPTGLTTAPYTDPHGYGTKSYDAGTWTSGWHDPGFAFSQAVPSWNAVTPGRTWIQVELRARTQDGRETKWYVLGRWASGDADFHRTSVPGQGDKDGFVAIDTFVPKKAMLAYQLRLTLYREAGSGA